ncbi:MAG: phosphoglucomutase/phosphomannomutase family protein [Candidatus Margulisbacteria bacterium]|nr:phosphoglucomutase/phosphomannomutase family protein [Candidatus Margulisiibacteriota bacterium]MBU1022592.1 phosphoglucomutase/phosphomannomutase family protein [Candidatus Margulisiibacteriota bacterium]MBU1728878.1 phosphoglucomutase/phosphomannomutase family protein [Candidatus Margulisiibacteriota bacterium]MBU1955509.1 phosphoglucomutase/phosphomannomutase family protein [Candidatus Margulisiibacteriota bacterium]
MKTIKFGTDGWRAEIGKDFTFDGVALVAQALVQHIIETGAKDKPVVVGYDNRFLSEKFAALAAEIVSSNGIKTLLFDSSVPSQLTAFATKTLNCSYGIMITASHNPATWNGFKIKENYGGSAQPETTKKVEEQVKKIQEKNIPIKKGNLSNIEKINLKEKYFDQLKKIVDVNLIKTSKTKIIIDPMHGSSAGLLKEFLARVGIEAIEIRGKRDPLFGGVNPEPLPINLEALQEEVKEDELNFGKNIVGIACDGDGDRIGGMDETGEYLSSHNMFSLLLKHMVENKKLSGDVVKTFNISRLVTKQAQAYKRKLHEVPIGFKYIVKLLLSQDILIGGEESGGIGIKGHIPERDGILCGLLLIELLAKEGKPARAILNDLMDQFGYFYYNRIDLHMDRQKIDAFINQLKNNPPKKIGGKNVANIEDLDGIKLNFEDESWILFRASGTEPLIRIYCEARTTQDVDLILGESQKLI